MWPQYSPWMMKPAACGYWSTLGWPSHGVSSFRSVCGQGQSGGERAEGHRVLQKGETLFTRTFPLSVGRLNLGKFLLCPKLPDGLLIFHALINARLWRYMIRISVTAIDGDVLMYTCVRTAPGPELHYVQALLMQACASIRAFEERSPHLNGAVNVNR